MKVRPLGKDQYRTLWIDLIEKCNAQQQEIEQLKQNLKIQETLTMREMAKVESLTADKDEQAGRIIKQDTEIKRLRQLIGIVEKCEPDGAEIVRKAFQALLGGKEDV